MDLMVAVQLYTLRDETSRDFAGTLEKVAEIGYKGVEFAGYGDMNSGKMKTLLDRLGLKAAGSHVGIDLLDKELDAVIDYSLEIGNTYIVCPWAEYASKDDYLKSAYAFNKIGEKCKKSGLQFCYHNHAHEFTAFDGEYGLDIIFNNTDPDLVKLELDTYWVQYAGLDPVGYMQKYKNRLPLIHQKDMSAGEDKGFTEVGNGIMDIAAIAKAGKELGSQWFIIEQDICTKLPLESVKISFENLRIMHLV